MSQKCRAESRSFHGRPLSTLCSGHVQPADSVVGTLGGFPFECCEGWVSVGGVGTARARASVEPVDVV